MLEVSTHLRQRHLVSPLNYSNSNYNRLCWLCCKTHDHPNGTKTKQAVALQSQSNLSVFYIYKIIGYQNTLLAKEGNQFYRKCDIHSTIDFIILL